MVGDSSSSWGTPVNAFVAGTDTFVDALDGDLAVLRNTFLGSAGEDHAISIALFLVGEEELFIVTGDSDASWGASVDPYVGGKDAFIARLDGTLTVLQNSFLGSVGDDWITNISVDSLTGYEVIAGASAAAWGSPIQPYAGGIDGFIALKR